MDKIFLDIFRTATYYTFSEPELHDIFPINILEKIYYKFKSEEVRKNMIEIIKSILNVYFVVYGQKCCMCKNYSNYTHDEKNWYCYRHKTKKMSRRDLSDNLPFCIDGKFIHNYNSCIDAASKYSKLARDINNQVDLKVNYRTLSTMYFCLSSYMDDAPFGVYPKSYKNIVGKVYKPEIFHPVSYNSFDISDETVKKREKWVQLYKEGKLF